MYEVRNIKDLSPDTTNPRTPDPHRLHLLRLSLTKLGFILPIAVTRSGLVLSGHQRLTVAKQIGWVSVPTQIIDLPEKDVKGINILFNRVTNDFGALDTGSHALEDLKLTDIISKAEGLPDQSNDYNDWFITHCKESSIEGIAAGIADQYDKKAVVIANNFLRKGIRIPVVISESGTIVNGVHRLFSARESGEVTWPIVTIPDDLADFAIHFLNYLSMDFNVGEEFADMLRFSAYRRPQNNRGSVPKAYRFWANGEKTIPDKESYTTSYWRVFRKVHGHGIIDFGSGLSKVAPFLRDKGFDCIDFEPYRIDPDSGIGKPSPLYSKSKAREFLEAVADGSRAFDSIFLASVLNSVPFPEDRMHVLIIVHALCSFDSTVYGTCRDISDFHYEYGGIRQANYFVFDSEPGVRLGDAVSNPKLQKFTSQKEQDAQLKLLWKTTKYWNGGNVFYFTASNPKRVNPAVLRKSLIFEFGELPYVDGTTMNLASEALESFNSRLGFNMQPLEGTTC